MRGELLIAVALLITGCGDSTGPGIGTMVGDWRVDAVDGQALPQQLAAFPQPVWTAAVLHITNTSASIEACELNQDQTTSLQTEALTVSQNAATALVGYPAKSGFIADTLTIAGSTLTWAYAGGVGVAKGQDHLTLTRLSLSPIPGGSDTCFLPH